MLYLCVKITQMTDSGNHTKGYTYQYPHPAVTTDCVVFGFDGKELKILLIERGIDPFKGMWAFPGGFLRMNETAEECAKRELKEETGLELEKVRELGTFSGVNRDPRERVVSIAFYSLAKHSAVRGGDDAAKAKWWALDDVPQLAFDHDYILRRAMKRIRQDIHFEPVGFDLLDEQFTIAELQRLYEGILGVRFDRRNFYRKMLQTGVLVEVEEDETPTASYFGKREEMTKMDIDKLFDRSSEASATPSMALRYAPTPKKAHPVENEEDSEKAKEENRNKTRHELLMNNSLDSISDENASTMMCGESAPAENWRNVGRKGKLYRFNEKKYNQMKEEGSFRLEF